MKMKENNMATIAYPTRENYGYDEFVFIGETRQVGRGEFYLYENQICKAFKYDLTRNKYPILEPVIKYISKESEARKWCKANGDRIVSYDHNLFYAECLSCGHWEEYKVLTYMGENGMKVWKPLSEFEVAK